jgi:hypothetical protein
VDDIVSFNKIGDGSIPVRGECGLKLFVGKTLTAESIDIELLVKVLNATKTNAPPIIPATKWLQIKFCIELDLIK